MGAREKTRRDNLRKIMEQENIDGYLIVDPINVSYLTGFNGEDSYLWVGNVGSVLLSDSRFTEQIKEEVDDIDAVIRRSGETTIGLLERAMYNTKYSTRLPRHLGIEAGSMTIALYQTVYNDFPMIEIVPCKYDVERLREIKDDQEIELIKSAIDTSILAYRETRSHLSSDATEVDFRDELEYRMRRLGGDEVAFASIVAYDKRAALPHAIPSRGTSINDASLVLVDWGVKQKGYVGDLTRTFLTERGQSNAEFSSEFKKVFDVVLEAHDRAIEAMKPGVPCADVDKIARDVIASAGYGEYFGHGLGHGIGRVVHDYGGLSPRTKDVLQANMVLTVEPGIYLPDWGGIRIEDDVLITESGAEVLSKALSDAE